MAFLCIFEHFNYFTLTGIKFLLFKMLKAKMLGQNVIFGFLLLRKAKASKEDK